MSLQRWAPVLLCFAGLSAQGLRAQSAKAAGAAPDDVVDAATSANQNQEAPQTRIVTRSDLVLAPVVLTGRKNQPILGLPQGAFHLEEDGKEQKISVFEEITTDNQAPKEEKPANPADVSNFALDRSHEWRVTIIVLDLLNTPFMRQDVAKKALIDYLSKQITRDEPTALFGLNSTGLHQLHPFTTDATVLIAALKQVSNQYTSIDMSQSQATADANEVAETSSASSSNNFASTASSVAQFLQTSDDIIAAFYQRDATRTTLAAFNQIAQAYKAVPGRKTLIWATGGFPFMIDDPQSFGRMGVDLVEDYEKTWRTLISANVAVYPIDAQGLIDDTFSAENSSITLGSATGSMGGPGGRGYSSPIRYDRHMEQQETMRSVASATGGKACVDFNGLEKCFADAVGDSRTYYMLGFYLQGENQKPGWHKLKVKVDASGAHVRAREGFYISSPADETPAARLKQLREAVMSPIAYTGVRMEARALADNVVPTAPGGTQGSKRIASFLITLPADNFGLSAAAPDALDLEVVGVAFASRSGKAVNQTGHSVYVKLNPEKLDSFRKTGLRIRQMIDLAPGSYEMKFAVRDNSTGQVGTVFLPYAMK